MALPYDDFGEAKRLAVTVRFLLEDVEIHSCAVDNRQTCTVAEDFLRHMHARGFRPRIVVECLDDLNRQKIERYLRDISYELNMVL